MTKIDMEKLRRDADAVVKRTRDKVVSVPEDSGVRGEMVKRAAAKVKRRRLNSLEHRGLVGLRRTRSKRT